VLLLIFFVAGLVVAFVAAILSNRARVRLGIAAVGVLLWVAYVLYVEKIYTCPRSGECDKGLGIFFLASSLAGWLGGVGLSWLVRRPARR